MSVNIWIWNDSDRKRKQWGSLNWFRDESVSLWVSESDALWLGTSPCLSDLESSHVFIIVCDGLGVCGPQVLPITLSLTHTRTRTRTHTAMKSSSRVPVMKGRRALRYSEVWQMSDNLYRLSFIPMIPFSLIPQQCLWHLDKSFL